jgi:CHASE2 domain-containing sensor protein
MKNNIFSNSVLKNKFLIATIISGMVICILLLLELTFGLFFSQINLYLQNSLYTAGFSKNNTVHPNIMLVTIDDATLKNTKDGGLGRWQDFRRSYYAQVIDNLKRDGAAVIGIDVLFSEESDAKEDIRLAQSINNAGNVVLGFSKKEDFSESIYPLDMFRDKAFNVGYFNPTTNKANLTVYSLSPITTVDNSLHEAFAVSLVRSYYDILHGTKTSPLKKNIQDSFYSLYPEESSFIPFAEKDSDKGDRKEALINYVAERNRFPHLSFVDVYNDRYDKEKVKDAIIILGSTATALHDEFATPVDVLP